ncbi:MAG: hypothetical protein ABF311_10640 [Polaribacter sp.]
METHRNNHRNITLSTKATVIDKIELKEIAKKNDLTLSELIYSLITVFKNQYENIGKDTPEEERLKKELQLKDKALNKAQINLENADYKVTLEMERADKASHKFDECRYQLKEALARETDLKNHNEELVNENSKLKETVAGLNDYNNNDNYQKAGIGLAGIVAASYGFMRLLK